MYRSMLKAKIHRATVTATDLNYEGSLSVDDNLLKAAGLMPLEQVMIYNISNGERFETYLIKAEAGSGVICLNGAAARKAQPGDLIIIASYGLFSQDELSEAGCTIISVGSQNQINSQYFQYFVK